MAERQLPKLNVAGSIPVSRSNKMNNLQIRTVDNGAYPYEDWMICATI